MGVVNLEEVVSSIVANMESAPTNYLEYHAYKHYRRRELYLEDVDPNSARELVRLIIDFNKDDLALEAADRKPITLYINSDGGCMTDCYAIVDAIRLSKTPVHTVCVGTAYSAGALVLLAGHKRIMYPSSSFMLHEGSTGVFGDAGKVKDVMKFYEKQLGIMKDLVLSKTKIDPELYEQKQQNDWFITAQEALELGIVDEIATSF